MLVSLEDMKEYLGITGSEYDDFLTAQILIVSQAIENYCGRVFNETSYVQTFYGDDYNTEYREYAIYAFHYPITTLTSISDSGTLLSSTDYRIHNESGTMYRIESGLKRSWFTQFTSDNYIEVSYDAGYATIPADIEYVVFSLVEEAYVKKVNNIGQGFGNDVQRVAIPGVMSLDFDYSLQANERKTAFGMILGNYVNVLDFYRSERAMTGTIKKEDYVS